MSMLQEKNNRTTQGSRFIHAPYSHAKAYSILGTVHVQSPSFQFAIDLAEKIRL